ncbi:hypothetical protein OQA88_11582 [Cercophora sp. LCS_1]
MRSFTAISLLAGLAVAKNAVPTLWDGSCCYPRPDVGFELDSYLGRWYQVAGTPEPYNRNCKCTFAQYALNAAPADPQYGAAGVFRVQFPGQPAPDCPGPNYIVQDYTGEFSLVQSNNFTALFILSRNQHPDEKVLDCKRTLWVGKSAGQKFRLLETPKYLNPDSNPTEPDCIIFSVEAPQLPQQCRRVQKPRETSAHAGVVDPTGVASVGIKSLLEMTRSSFLAIATVAFGLLAGVQAEDTELCGEAAFYPSEYNCYNNTALCPIIYHLPTVPCGASGCVAPQAVACDSGKLKSLPRAISPFTLTAWGTRSAYRGQPVKACGGYLAIGANARECISCNGAEPGVDCKSYKGKTVLLPDGAMASDVRGGQYWYVNPRDGVLQYTAAVDPPTPKNGTGLGWNATTPLPDAPGKEFAGQRVTVLENGFFDYDSSSHYWFACLRTLNGGTVGTGRSWRIYSSSASNVEWKECERIKLVATAVDRKQGAFRYE